jgi:hypothetical protein
MLEGLDLVKWDSIPQPDWNRPGEVPSALRALAVASGDADSQEAYNRLLYATGNNHAGTYYPVALDVVPFLGEILIHGQLYARLRALDILVDYLASFSPEPGHENVPSFDGSPMPLNKALQGDIARVWNHIAPEIMSSATDARELDLAAQLISLLAEADELAYVASLEHERHMYAWCHVRYGGVAPDIAAALASNFYIYEPPDNDNRRLVFHDQAWHWAMLGILGDGYWRGHPERETASDEYRAEARRLADEDASRK